MRIDVLTLFPGMFVSPLESSILRRARGSGLLLFRAVDNPGDTTDRHRTCDDTPFGGGVGMVMKAEPIFRAAEAAAASAPPGPTRRIVLSPAGRVLDQQLAGELAREPHLLLVCGRYEGIDERVHR